MTLHPIVALDQVVEEYSDYLQTEFRAKDPALREALERELDQPRFLAQEPFFRAHRPFRNGRRWCDLPIDPRLAQVMKDRAGAHGSPTPEHAFVHQSEAIGELLSADAHPVVVTTGTGSGKTEAFLLPVIQNAIHDATRFRQSGLTAILVYPMNALANDQLQRIEDYLQASGFGGTVSVGKYDRGTKQAEREAMRRNPPHILLTNYMMLEYLLVRPADREDIFANHRCRFLVLDEVHTYRGALGSNIALLVRRLKAHLARARQDWFAEVPAADHPLRYPALVPVGTSATIKSITEEGSSPEEARRQRDQAVQEFFAKLTGAEPTTIRVLGEEIQELQIPEDSAYPPESVDPGPIEITDPESVRQALCRLAGLSLETPLGQAAQRCRLLWDLNRWLIGSPLSLSQIVERVQQEVPLRASVDPGILRREVESALIAGAALPDGTPGALRLRAHRFIRGGWRFHRCLNPNCGRLYPMGEDRCSCGFPTAPLYLCRNCGAHYLRFVGEPLEGTLRPSSSATDGPEWLLYEYKRFETLVDDEEEEPDENGGRSTRRRRAAQPDQIGGRPVLRGSFDPATLAFSPEESDYPLQVVLAPARTRCLCCGGTAGSAKVITPIALGTSAALKTLAEGLVEALDEANRDRPGYDGKERLLIFSDSRQDAAHQARFILFASRYDRMRRRLVQLLQEQGELSIQQAVERLGGLGVQERDNPNAPPDVTAWIPEETRHRIRAWEEAPLLDDLAINAGYRATVIKLGLVGVRYHELDDYIRACGAELAGRFGLSLEALGHICRCLLDEMRVRGSLSRPLLRYHPRHTAYPDYMNAAEWERGVKSPQGYAAADDGSPLGFLDSAEVPPGIINRNFWRRPGAGGRSPGTQRILGHLLAAFGGAEPDEQAMLDLMTFLQRGQFIIPSELYGSRDRRFLLQVNAEVVRLRLLQEEERVHCGVCGAPLPLAPLAYPCPLCHGRTIGWPDADLERNRSVRRIRAPHAIPLVAGEHTAQVPNEDRSKLEDQFKAPATESKVNVLACSPTLEMGIDVGGLDAVALRNVPPRPDNYAQRGGRAGRRARVGLVIGYARNTPHDQYFYDKPTEMIAGEIPAPAIALGNRDIMLRHLNAIVFGSAQPGLASQMQDYVSPTGVVNQEAVEELITALRAQFGYGLQMAREAFGADVLAQAGLDEDQIRRHLAGLPAQIQNIVDRTARQVAELRRALDDYARELRGQSSAVRAGSLVARLLGIRTEQQGGHSEDLSAGYPLRRFAEFGLLPGYEFPTEPAALRLLGDAREEDPVSVNRPFGIGQYQPDAQVYARAKRWKVIGLDTASPWNPGSDEPSWMYRKCEGCGLRYRADHPRCPRCGDDRPGPALAAYEFGGFLAHRDERPVLDEEERFAVRNLVRLYPQWDGDVIGRWRVAGSWSLQLSQREEIHWLNEGPPPTQKEMDRGVPFLHPDARGYLLCGLCGYMLTVPEPPQGRRRGRQQPQAPQGDNPYGHRKGCANALQTPRPLALATEGRTDVLRLILPIPGTIHYEDLAPWGLSLGYALRIGMQHLYMLDGSEIEFVLEGPWVPADDEAGLGRVALAFVDPSLGGTGYLERAAEDLHLIARRTLEHLDHPDCETACYRCLKSYGNQRFHDQLRWPLTVPYLEALAAQPSERQPLELGDIDDPAPWLEAYSAGVGSPLELRFLRLFEQHGFYPEKQVPIAPAPSQPAISVADFAVPEHRLAIYVDGASFHVGPNLRRDRAIRDRLRNAVPPWQVIELRAGDLREGAALVERLRQAR